MSSAVLATRETSAAPRSGLRPRGVTWLTWRQTRAALLVVTLGYAAALAYLLYQHHQFDVTTVRLRGLHCSTDTRDPVSVITANCNLAALAVMQAASGVHRLATVALAAPGLLGAVLAAQPLAVDLERGRHRLLWSQSVSPRRWFTQRMLLPAAILLVLSAVLSVALRWAVLWTHPALPIEDWSFDNASDALAPVYPLLTLAAFALGAVVGLLLHRVIAALGITLALYGVLLYGMAQVRPYLVPLHRKVVGPGDPWPSGDWVYDSGPVVHGKDFSYSACPVATGCDKEPSWILYHPLSQFGPMLWVETGMLAALTAGLVALAYRRLLALTR
ncbi:hypothetical protein [Streptacidiphilus anmyonensis]|uniref:hypothetical protein n=1 Tax=Streptacidiphilus anmyonensis TaxID=405782 RepID=UPI0005A97BD1|nr:hypothetical protein [Streptacidiphilus anmyonensis]